jgi:hypothetical protein
MLCCVAKKPSELYKIFINGFDPNTKSQSTSKIPKGVITALTSFFEEFFAVFAGEGNGARYVANELYDVSQVVFVSGVLLPRVRLKQVIS